MRLNGAVRAMVAFVLLQICVYAITFHYNVTVNNFSPRLIYASVMYEDTKLDNFSAYVVCIQFAFIHFLYNVRYQDYVVCY